MNTSSVNALVKPPHRRQTYTEEQLQQFVLCADPRSGPMYFLENFFYIQHPVLGQLRYQPYDYQRRLIATYHSYRFSIALMPRQSGKSTSAAGYLLWYAMFVPDSTILVAAHKFSGAGEIMTRVRYAYELCADHIRAGATSYNKHSIEFENGSRIVAQTTTETTGRGMSISLLYADEFAFVRPTIAKEFWTSISPTLATGGKAIVTSTPNSDEDQFALLWKGANRCQDEYGNATEIGINGFRAYRAYWNEHPDRDSVWANEQRAQLGEERFRREMDCDFVIDDETLISPTKLLELFSSEPIERTGQVRWYKKPQADRRYIVALDPSLGTGGDPAAIQVFEAETVEQVAEWTHNRTDIPGQIRVMVSVVQQLNAVVNDINSVYYSVENNTIGEAALISIAEYGEHNIPGYFLSDNSVTQSVNRRWRKGFNTTNKSKITACNKLKILIESDRMRIHSQGLLSELKTFIALGNSYQAKTGERDDLVMASLLVVRMLILLQNYHTDLDEYIRDHSDTVVEPMPFISVRR